MLEVPLLETRDELPNPVTVDRPRAPGVVERLHRLFGCLVRVEAGRRMKPRIGGVVCKREILPRGVEPPSRGARRIVHSGSHSSG